MDLPGFDFETSQDVLAKATGATAGQVTTVPVERLSNATAVAPQVAVGTVAEPVVASIYQLDSLVRRASSLQQTADGRLAHEGAAA